MTSSPNIQEQFPGERDTRLDQGSPRDGRLRVCRDAQGACAAPDIGTITHTIHPSNPWATTTRHEGDPLPAGPMAAIMLGFARSDIVAVDKTAWAGMASHVAAPQLGCWSPPLAGAGLSSGCQLWDPRYSRTLHFRAVRRTFHNDLPRLPRHARLAVSQRARPGVG